MIKRKVIGHKYISSKFDEGEFSVETDYINNKIYLGAAQDDADIDVIEAFAKAVLVAVEDMRRHEEKEAVREKNVCR